MNKPQSASLNGIAAKGCSRHDLDPTRACGGHSVAWRDLHNARKESKNRIGYR
jgi:hypothetical protein